MGLTIGSTNPQIWDSFGCSFLESMELSFYKKWNWGYRISYSYFLDSQLFHQSKDLQEIASWLSGNYELKSCKPQPRLLPVKRLAWRT